MAKEITVHEVSYDLPDGADTEFGRAARATFGHTNSADGYMATARFRDKTKADAFAKGKTFWGRAASVLTSEVPRRLAQRWGLA